MANIRHKYAAYLTTYFRILGLAVSLITTPAASFALGTSDERAACAADAFRLCGSEIPNIDRIVACMRANKGNLSSACKAVFDNDGSATTTAVNSK